MEHSASYAFLWKRGLVFAGSDARDSKSARIFSGWVSGWREPIESGRFGRNGLDAAIRWGMVGMGVEKQWIRLDVEVYKGVDEPPADIGMPVYYPDWWLNQVTFQ